jgi:predicted DNA-binding protein
MLVRKQIVVPTEVDKRIRRLARQKGISQSALIVEAVEAMPETSSQVDHLLAFAGVVKEAPPQLSEEVDEVVYR